MQKNDLKNLIKDICESLLERIDSNESSTKEQIINYLRDSVDTISNINDEDISSIEHAKASFNNKYKDILNQSLSSYEFSNNKFRELTQLQEQTIGEYSNNCIDIPTLTSKFDEIQSHMTKEVEKANKIILNLTAKVKILEEVSNLDALTKVFNRRALNTYLSDVCSNKDINYNIHALMLDIDDFKIINDKYGHITGDKILIFISNILRKTLRDGDKIFRYGGEEFTIILNRNNDEECSLIANRILKLISSNNLIYMGQKISVTASIGYTKLIKNDIPDTLLARADKALYLSKHNGKNKVSGVME
ncbi:MAG: GGDEF domain-containing protein [Sulfurimonas sp.]|nr:GGDEF domain-containing protein [Sulfurimonas sp.]